MNPSKKRMIERLKKARAFVVVTWDGEKEPVVAFNVNACSDEEKDPVHFLMRECSRMVFKVCDSVAAAVSVAKAEYKAGEEARRAKEKRSEELAAELDKDVAAGEESLVKVSTLLNEECLKCGECSNED